MKKIITFFMQIVMLMTISCNNKLEYINSPLATVVMLKSAESANDFVEARRYIDIQSVYSNPKDTISADLAWQNEIAFYSAVSADKKFTNDFKYFKYDIREVIEGDSSEAIFEAKNREASIQKITYKLRKYAGQWKVVKIEYKKK